MRLFLLLFLLSGAVRTIAQDDLRPIKLFERHDVQKVHALVDTPATDTTNGEPQRAPGDVTVIADPRIERLMDLHAEHKHLRPGYRVQIFLGDRRMAEETKRAFLQKHPELPVYISWLAPNFRLRIGDLRTRLEAEHLLRQLRVEHPGSYIVRDEIEMPQLTTGQ